MKRPPFLVKGDKIGIVAPARKISPAELEPAMNLFAEWGLEPVTSKNLFKEQNQFSASDEMRAADLQEMMNDASIKAIISARGGYGTVRIIDRLDFSSFIRNPKWICGYSDITVLHSHIHKNYEIETLHSTMPVSFHKDQASTESLRQALFGEFKSVSYPNKNKLNREGSSNGILVGGNLSILFSLAGTASDVDTKGKILFLEDLDEYFYHLDRMMMQMKRSGKLEDLAGLIIGGMTEMKDNAISFGKTAEEIILEAVQEYTYPVCFNFPVGHDVQNHSLYLGRNASLSVDKMITLSY